MLALGAFPKKPICSRPYFGEGQLHDWPYGNEWMINLYVLQEYGIILCGLSPKNIFSPISIEQVRQASRQDLYEEWVPKLQNLTWLDSSHYQAYTVLTMCRILYIEHHDKIVSKKIASSWVKQKFGSQWSDLIVQAEGWKHGDKLAILHPTVAFIQFVMTQIKPA